MSMIYILYLHNLLLLLHCDCLWGDRDLDLEQLQEPEREEEYEYLLLLGGERDTEGEEREEEQDEELELLLEWRGRYLEKKYEKCKGWTREILTPSYDNQDAARTQDILTKALTFSWMESVIWTEI